MMKNMSIHLPEGFDLNFSAIKKQNDIQNRSVRIRELGWGIGRKMNLTLSTLVSLQTTHKSFAFY